MKRRRGSSIPKTTFFQNFAYGRVAARIAVTSVDGGFAQLSVIAGGTEALVIPLARRPTSGAVLTGESVASVALGQYLVGNFSYWRKSGKKVQKLECDWWKRKWLNCISSVSYLCTGSDQRAKWEEVCLATRWVRRNGRCPARRSLVWPTRPASEDCSHSRMDLSQEPWNVQIQSLKKRVSGRVRNGKAQKMKSKFQITSGWWIADQWKRLRGSWIRRFRATTWDLIKRRRKENGNQHVRNNESRCVGTYALYLDFTQAELLNQQMLTQRHAKKSDLQYAKREQSGEGVPLHAL